MMGTGTPPTPTDFLFVGKILTAVSCQVGALLLTKAHRPTCPVRSTEDKAEGRVGPLLPARLIH